MDLAIRTDELTKIYGNKITAVDGIGLEIPKGEIYGLIGPNGAGKTTTIRILMGILKPTSGQVVYNHNEQIDKEKVGYLPEDARYYKFMKVEEYLEFTCKLYRYSNCTKRVPEAIEEVGLKDLKERKIDELSKGQRQRLGVVQALVHSPDILILDEPTSGLDPMGKRKILDILQNLSGQQKTILISSHILPELSQICTHVGIIKEGKLITQGPLEKLRKRFPGSKLVLQFDQLGPEFMTKLEDLDFISDITCISEEEKKYTIQVKDPQKAKSTIPKLLVTTNSTLTYYDFSYLTLEDIFLELMEE